MPDILVIREQTVEALSGALRSGRNNLDVIPGLLRRAIKEEVWKERKDYRLTREIIPAFPSFRAFVEAKPPAGLGTKTDLIERIIRDDTDTLTLFRRATVGKKGTNQHTKVDHYNIMDHPKVRQGTSRAYVLDRLKRERPDLFTRVKANKLSANAAAIEAGFRKKPTPLEGIYKLLPKLSQSELEQLADEVDRRKGRRR